jgi:signal transduction histidine kinase
MGRIKTNRLLNKMLKYYLAFGFVLLLLTVPLFYILHEKYYAHEIEEYLVEQKDNTFAKSLRSLKTEDISVWNRYNDDKAILPDSNQLNETIFAIENLYSEREKKEEPHHVLYSKIQIEDKPYILMIRLSVYEAQKIIKTTSIFQFFLFIGLMIGFMLVTRLIYKRLWNPFFQTISQIEQFNIKSSEAPLFSETNIKEFIQLNKALEKLAENNRNAYKIQKEFTENASHEMQTPLAVFQSRLDMLIQQPDLTEGQLSIIQSLYDTTSRLSRMNKNLLLLAKMDNLQFAEIQTINVTGVINESLSLLTEQAGSKNIHIESSISPDFIQIQANKTLLESLVNNLITNAIRHNIVNGRIIIAFEGKRLSVANTGVNYPLDEKMLFRRFGRMSEKTKGSGLGLAIVQQICLLNNWQIKYSFNYGMHRFAVTF